MARGKYSLAYKKGKVYKYTCEGKLPEPREEGEEYDFIKHNNTFDDEGYDRYGYSCYDDNGNFIGEGEGIDRAGNTEEDYLLYND